MATVPGYRNDYYRFESGNTLDIFGKPSVPSYQPPVMSAPGSVYKNPSPGYSYPSLQRADAMLGADEFRPVRKADGTTFQASPTQVMLAGNVNLEGLSAEQVAKVKAARATFAKIATDPQAFDSLLKQISDEPGLKGMGDMLLALGGDKKAAQLFSDLLSRGKFGTEFTATLLNNPGWAQRLPDATVDQLLTKAVGGDANGPAIIAKLAEAGRLKPEMAAEYLCRLARSKPELSGSALTALHSSKVLKEKLGEDKLAQVSGGLLALKDKDWSSQLQWMLERDSHRWKREDGKYSADPRLEADRKYQEKEFGAFLDGASDKLRGKPNTDPQRSEFFGLCGKLLADPRFNCNDELIRSLQRLEPLSEKEKGYLVCAQDRRQMLAAANDPKSLMASPEQRQELKSKAAFWLLQNPAFASAEAARVLSELVSRPGEITADFLNSLRDVSKLPAGREFLGKVVTEHADPAVRKRAAELLGPVLHQATEIPAGRTAAAQLLAATGSPEQIEELRKTYQPSPFSQHYVDWFQKASGEALSAKVESALAGKIPGPLGEQLKKMAKLIQLQQIAYKTSDHKNARHVDLGKVRESMAKLVEESPLKEELAKLNRDLLNTRSSSSGSYYGEAVATYGREFTSPENMAKLELMPEAQRKAFVDNELKKISSMNPALAGEVAQRLQEYELEKGGPKALAEGDPAKLAMMLNAVMESTGQGKVGLTKEDISELQQALRDYKKNSPTIPSDNLRDGLDTVNRVLERFTEKPVTNALGKLARGMVGPKLGQQLALCSVLNMATNEFKTPEDCLRFTRDLFETAGNGQNVLKSATATGKLFRMGSLIKACPQVAVGIARVSRVCGPVGLALSVGLDGIDAVKSFQRGDNVGGAGSTTMAVGGALMLASLVPSPFTPFLFIGGAVVTGAGWIVRQFGDSEQVSLAKEMEVYRDWPR